MRRLLGILVLLLAAWFASPCLAFAQQAAGDALAIPIRVVNGQAIVLTDLVGLEQTNEASFAISLEYPDALTLHPDMYAWLGLDPKDPAKGPEALIHLLIDPGIKLSIPAKQVARERSPARIAAQNATTKLYSSALGERKLKGTIGVGLLARYRVTLDLSEQRLVLAPPHAVGESSTPPDLADIVVTPFDDRDHRIRVLLRYADDRRGQMIIGGTHYDSLVDAAVARAVSAPAGHVSPAWLADSRDPERRLDLSRAIAFRPKVFDEVADRDLTGAPDTASATGAERPVIIAGVNLLEQFRVDLDWSTRTIAFTQKKPAAFPRQDLAFFEAEVQGTADAMQAYLEQHPHDRLSREAAHLLVTWRLEKDKADDDRILQALTWVVRTSLDGRRAENCLAYAERFTKAERPALAIAAAQEGLTHARDAFDPRVVYSLHSLLGERYFAQGDLTRAWKHFLSVAFIMPGDVKTNLNLARIYDRQHRTRRAYSLYQRVAASPSLGREIEAEVAAALRRLRAQLPADDVLLAQEKQEKGTGRPRTEAPERKLPETTLPERKSSEKPEK